MHPAVSGPMVQEQGRIHDYLSQPKIDQQSSLAGAITRKLLVSAKKAKCYGLTDQLIEQVIRVASMRLKSPQIRKIDETP